MSPHHRQARRSNFIIGVTVALLTLGLWAYMNRPEEEPPWPKIIQGFSFSPMRIDDDPLERRFPSTEEIDADLALLAGKTHAIRTYSTEDIYANIPELAHKHKLNVTLGAWIDTRLENNEREIKDAIKLAQDNKNVVRVIVGNEAVLRGDVTVEAMGAYLDGAREKLSEPVSTAEPWHVWVKYPELAEHVDFLAVHMLPYWERVGLDRSVDYIVEHMNELKTLFPDKPIIITEVGWPSNGRMLGSAVADQANQAIFLRRFLDRAKKENYVYYIMEAFDQPWKSRTEGAVGAYWGVYNVHRESKFPLSSPIVLIPNWYILAGISVLLAGIVLAFLLIHSHTLRAKGRGFLAVIAYASATIGVWVVYDYTHQYLTIRSILIGIFMFIGMMGVIVIIITEAHEWAEAHWVYERQRPFKPVLWTNDQTLMVSIHVPAYNEPPRMLIETLEALSKLDYPNYEVIVVDNNTKDPAVWKPVETYCQTLGDRFRFFHVDPLPGFKAGALNFALRQTSPSAELIAVIDSDYVVYPQWLKELIPQFLNPKIAIVQAPQDYRDGNVNLFKSMCHSEYSGFFFIGMITRNERNAIIQHGTMTLIRKSVLEEVGAWGEWCIVEDAELGLRVFEKGYEAIYIHKSYGQGLMPDSFADFKKQRSRWAYGAMQIMKRHAGALFGRQSTALTTGQKYHFIAGWLPWVADAFNIIFNTAAIGWSAAMLFLPYKIDPPLVEFSLLPLTLFTFKICKIFYLYKSRIHASLTKIIAAAIAGLSLSYTISMAVLQGLLTSHRPFARTPKMASSQKWLQAILATRGETLLTLLLLMSAFALSFQKKLMTLDMYLWIIVLIIQAIPYASAILVSAISMGSTKKH